MAKPKTNMPEDLKTKCHVAIHTATAAASAGGAIPIPIADTIPISAAQVSMVVALGKIFDLSISQSAAKAIIGVGLAQSVGRFVFSNAIKSIPGAGQLLGSIIGASTAAAITEALGWLVADDFYRISIGENPEDIVDAVSDLNDFKKSHF